MRKLRARSYGEICISCFFKIIAKFHKSRFSSLSFHLLDAIYLSSSRQMLEPILEETSEDEEHAQNSWNQYEQNASFWSSAESETGSVIKVDISKGTVKYIFQYFPNC